MEDIDSKYVYARNEMKQRISALKAKKLYQPQVYLKLGWYVFYNFLKIGRAVIVYFISI